MTEETNKPATAVEEWVAQSNHVRRETIVVFRALKDGQKVVTVQYPELAAALKALVEIHAFAVEGPSNNFVASGSGGTSQVEYSQDPVYFFWNEKYGRPVERALITLAELHAKNGIKIELLFVEPDATGKQPVRAWILQDGYVAKMETDNAYRNLNDRLERERAAEEAKKAADVGEAQPDTQSDALHVSAAFNGQWNRGGEAFKAALEFLESAEFANPYEADAMGKPIQP